MIPLRRGACPGIANPMPTGDGLLARLLVSAPMSLQVFSELCEAGDRHGNGIVEVTQRGSLQFRGLNPGSAALFATAIEALDLTVSTAPPLLTPPLLGWSSELGAALPVAIAALRGELARGGWVTSLSPKVSLLIDGGGTLHLDEVSADVRVRADRGSRLHVSMAGTAATATHLGWVAAEQVVTVVLRLLESIAARGLEARAADIVQDSGIKHVRASLDRLLMDGRPPSPRAHAEPIGIHPLDADRRACGVGLAFGHANAGVLTALAGLARRLGASAARPVPGRALLFFGFSSDTAEEFAQRAQAAGFIAQAGDARRFVVACAGAPACASATLRTRDLAPAVAAAARSMLGPSNMIHLSGCSKGCAYSNAAALTFVGPNHLIVRGRADDRPDGTISAAAFLSGLSHLQSLDEAVLKSFGGEIA